MWKLNGNTWERLTDTMRLTVMPHPSSAGKWRYRVEQFGPTPLLAHGQWQPIESVEEAKRACVREALYRLCLLAYDLRDPLAVAPEQPAHVSDFSGPCPDPNPLREQLVRLCSGVGDATQVLFDQVRAQQYNKGPEPRRGTMMEFSTFCSSLGEITKHIVGVCGLRVGDRVTFLPGTPCYRGGMRTGTILRIDRLGALVKEAGEAAKHWTKEPVKGMMATLRFPLVHVDPWPTNSTGLIAPSRRASSG